MPVQKYYNLCVKSLLKKNHKAVNTNLPSFILAPKRIVTGLVGVLRNREVWIRASRISRSCSLIQFISQSIVDRTMGIVDILCPIVRSTNSVGLNESCYMVNSLR